MTIEAAPKPSTCSLPHPHDGPCDARLWDLSSYSDRELLESVARDAREARLVADWVRVQAPPFLSAMTKGPLGMIGSMFGMGGG